MVLVPVVGRYMTFCGTEFPDDPKTGDIVMKGNDIYAYLGDRWENIGTSGCEETPKEPKPMICTRCGAPMNGHKCEYCGTEYLWRSTH